MDTLTTQATTQDLMNQVLINEWGLQDLSPEEQQDTLLKIEQTLFKASISRGIELLTEEEQDKLEAHLALFKEDEYPEQTLVFLNERIPDFQSIISEEAEKIHTMIVTSNK